jgi:hypothetical protein
MDNITQTEKEFKDLSNEAKQGIHLKEEFYSFVAVNNI